VNREEGGREAIEANGIQVVALTTTTELLADGPTNSG
jgi:orotate phosphoribosyltransferase